MTKQSEESTNWAVDAYLKASYIRYPAGAGYADSKRKFQGIPGLTITHNGRLWATWYGGGVTEDRNNYVLLTTSGDGGSTWAAEKWVIDPDGDGPVRAFDPCLWHDPDGRMWWFWAQGYEGHTDARSGVWAAVAGNADADKPHWSEPQRICDGIMMNKPTVLSSGVWLLPVAQWHA